MVVIRLARGGAKKRPFYHIVATDKRQRRDSRYIEKIGYYNPIAAGAEKRLVIKGERFTHWLEQGAQTSQRVTTLYNEWLKSPETAEAAKLPTHLEQKIAAAKAAPKKPKAEKPAEAQEVKAEEAAPAAEAAPAEEAAADAPAAEEDTAKNDA
jgi:small subunit ribosomal protein S16